ncbi:unnamed protein product [Prorocentrum cordatum]|uniref:Autophagy-related protein 9 n=1 Tax=Prorocentrum cordatum TaxID=2364126 RepID=A0ABN9TYB9_9DINO|nr:unnamed protein product [Polarella glacialis]
MATACCGAQRVAAGPEPARKPAAAPRAAPRPPRARGPAAGFWRGPAWASPAPLGLALALLVACRGALRLGGLPAGGAAGGPPGGGGGVSRGRLLSSAVGAQEAGATLDEVGTWVFSRPPHSRLERSEAVFWLLAGIYAYCGLVVAVGLYLDVRDWRWRADRSTSPQVLVPVQFCCSRILIRQSSLPSQIADQYYLDARALKPSSDADVVLHTRPTNFWGYAFRYAKGFGDALSREHLAFSLLVWVAPTFPRPKRSFLVVLHLHACMLTAALVLNRREHEEPQGTYEVFKCASGGSGCMATCPLAVAAGAALLPVFQILQRQFRLTSFVSQEHVCNSLFPLGTRKFATMPRRSTWDSICCRRNSLERQTHKIEQRRHVLHRAVKALWMATRPSVADLSFYTGQTSWCMLFAAMSFLAAVVLYLVFFTLYLGQAAADHFGVWTLTMHFSSLLLVEPLWIFLTRVFWNALVTDVGQYWGLGAQSVTATTTYSHLVRNIEESFFGKVKDVGSRRIQRWWLDVLHMRRSIQRETLAAIKLQTIWRSTSQRVKHGGGFRTGSGV